MTCSAPPERGRFAAFSAWMGIALIAASITWWKADYVALGHAAKIAAGLMLAGAVSLVVGSWNHRGAAIALAVTVAVSMLAADTVLAWLEASYQPVVTPFGWLVRLLLPLGGLQTASEGRDVLVQSAEGLFVVRPTMGLVGMRALACFWLGGGMLLAVAKEPPPARAALAVLLVPTVLVGLRFTVACAALVSTDDVLGSQEHLGVARFWNPWTLLVALLLSGLILATVLPRVTPGRVAPLGPFRTGALVTGAAFLAFALAWVDPGVPGRGRVLIDDRLSGLWEPAGRLLTPDRFGDFSTYSFSTFTEHLSRRFAVTVNSARSYDRELLADQDVLILKTPHEALAEDEIAAIHEWLRDGGGLFAIGDHTDLGGMNTVLNRLTEPYGIRFRFDSVGCTDGGYNTWNEPWISDHPVAHGLGSTSFMTGCSMELDWTKRARPVLILDRASSAEGDYSRESNFGTLAPHPGAPQGRLVAAAASEYGGGRVVAFSDSTVLSSFSYFLDQHSEITLRAVAWLNCAPLHTSLLKAVWGLLAVVGIVLSGRRVSRAAQPIALAAACVGFLSGLWGASRGSGALLTVPPSVVDVPRVGFVIEGGHAWLPPVLGSEPEIPEDGNLATLFQIPQRFGMESRVIPRSTEELEGLASLWILNPDAEDEAPPSAGWTAGVRSWVERGGSLVVMFREAHRDHPHGRTGYLDDLSWEHVDLPTTALHLDRASSGAGQVLRVSGSERLSVSSIGHCMSYPDSRQRSLYEAIYALIETLQPTPVDRRSYVRILSG